ncbi:MAG TPA: PQQ-binding-like beta-propeller repeat protein [Candidatus Binatia bacterium]|nr:PQQ-binding-like beta-propeller repeat protein [Candidatus Binatia bacterium]
MGAGVAVAAAALIAAQPSLARANLFRCPIDLQQNICLEATGTCPPYAPVGPAASDWPVFQQNAQHTGRSPETGPTCANEVWRSKVKAKVLSAPVVGADGTLYVASAKNPICALDPSTGAIYWCSTDNLGRLPDYCSPAVGNGNFIYIGTRDNDLWAIDIPPRSATEATVAWRQKVCTDGDVTTPPLVGPDGLVYMGSNSLSAGTIMAMCPGPTRTVKWCIHPLDGGISNVSPALSPANDVLYLTHSGAYVDAVNASTGQQYWSVRLEHRLNGVRVPNYTPVVHPTTGKVYVGFDTGLWEVTPPATPTGTPSTRLLFATYDRAHERVLSPPALDVARGTIFLLASRRLKPTFYALDFDGNVKWSKSTAEIGNSLARNTPPIVDAAGNVYLAVRKALYGFGPNGNALFTKETPAPFASSPILANGLLYAATVDGTVYAMGGCP